MGLYDILGILVVLAGIGILAWFINRITNNGKQASVATSENKQTENKETGNTKKNWKSREFFLSTLQKIGCTCEIEREYANSENEKKEFYTAMQFITNGMYKLKKYILTFDFGNEKNNTMLNNIMVQNSFNEKLKFELKKLLNIKSASKNIIIGNPRAGPYIVSAIIKQSNFNELNEIEMVAMPTGVLANKSGLTRRPATISNVAQLFEYVKQNDKNFV